LTGCAETVVQAVPVVPYVDPNLFVQRPQPTLGPGDASWDDLAELGFELKGWGETCYADKREIQGVLREASGEAERERDAREK